MPSKDEIGVIYIPKTVQLGGKLGPEVLEIVSFVGPWLTGANVSRWTPQRLRPLTGRCN